MLSLAVGLLPGAIERLCLAYPGIAVRLHEYLHRDELVRASTTGSATSPSGRPLPPAPGRSSSSATRSSSRSWATTSGVRLARCGQIDELADDDWILFPAWHGLHGLVTAICAHAGFTPRDAIRTAQVEAAVRLAAGGLGVAIVPANIVPLHLQRHVRRLDPPVFRVLYAYTRVEWSPQAHALLTALEEEQWPSVPIGSLVLD